MLRGAYSPLMKPLVSILIPAYNAQEFIAEAITSAIDQTWTNKEVIIVDDGSTDRTYEIANGFSSGTVRVATQENQGAAAARNAAYAMCQGDFIQWLDADDLLDRRKVESQIQVSCEVSPRTLLSGAWGSFNYRQRKATFTPTALWCDLSPVDWLLQKMSNNLHMQTDNWLVSRALSEVAGPWDVRLWRDNDGEYFCRVILAADTIRFVQHARSYYRAAGFNSVSYIGESSKKLESLFISMQLHICYLRSIEDSARTRAACVRYIQNWLSAFYPYRLDLAERLKAEAAQLGTHIPDPELSWKYQWIVKRFGWKAGKKAQLLLPKVKNSAKIAWDRALAGLEARGLGAYLER